MIKKSLIQGLWLWIITYLLVLFLNIFEIEFLGEFIFTPIGAVSLYMFLAVGNLMYMRL